MAKKIKKTSKSSDTIEAISKISRAISSDLYLEDILKLIVTVTAEVMNSRICSLMLLDEKKQNLNIRATQSISEAYINKKPLAKGEGVAWKAVLGNRPIAILDVTKEPEYKNKDIAIKEGLVSLLCVPLIVKNKAIGVLNCYTSTSHKFTPTEINVLTSVANQAAIAIEHTELMVKTKVIQEELETRREPIGRAIESLAQTLEPGSATLEDWLDLVPAKKQQMIRRRQHKHNLQIASGKS